MTRIKFWIPGYFWVGKSGKYFFGWFDLIRDFLGIQNNLIFHVKTNIKLLIFLNFSFISFDAF